MDSVSVDDRREHINGMHKIDQAPADLHAGRRRIPDKFPPVALLILVVEVCYPTAKRRYPHLHTNTDSLAWRAVHLLWPQRSNAELYQVRQARNS
jgi:hypothetical protein